MQTQAKKGFTLIELLVVIVIIGILATISVATFSGYFKKARDSERQAAIRNAATLMKTARAVNTITTFDTLAADMAPGISGSQTGAAGIAAILLAEGGYAMPAASTSGFTFHYYGVADDFAVYTCSEENAGTVISDGTAGGLATISDATTDPACASTGVTAGTDATTVTITGS